MFLVSAPQNVPVLMQYFCTGHTHYPFLNHFKHYSPSTLNYKERNINCQLFSSRSPQLAWKMTNQAVSVSCDMHLICLNFAVRTMQSKCNHECPQCIFNFPQGTSFTLFLGLVRSQHNLFGRANSTTTRGDP